MSSSTTFVFQFLQRFDWQSEDAGVSISFDVTAMLRDITAGRLVAELVTAPLDETFALTWVSKRDLNFSYCNTMSPVRRNIPVLGAWMPDGTVLLIDGSHRYWARYSRGENEIDYLLIREKDWKPYATIKGELK